MRLGGMAPPLLRGNFRPITSCPDGCLAGLQPRFKSVLMVALYGCKTRRLSALGQGVGESHQRQLTASLTRMGRTVTHSAGVGSLAGFPPVEILGKVEAKVGAQHDEELEMIQAAGRLCWSP